MATRPQQIDDTLSMPIATALPGYETKAKRRRKTSPSKVDDIPVVMGRPTDYRPEFVEIAKQMYERGAADPEVAEILEVSVSTIVRWGNQHPDFCVARRVGKAAADDRVERALYQNAIFGETSAQIFWLKNRRYRDWQDKRDISFKDETPPSQFDIRRLPPELREQFRAMMMLMLDPAQVALMAPIEGEFTEADQDDG